MRTPRIYAPQTLALNTPIALNTAAAHYLLKVLRCEIGRPLVIFNGEGGEFHGKITDATKKCVEVTLYEFFDEDRQSPLFTELAIGVSRGDRFDWVLQKATELGVNRIVPLITERTEVKLSGERAQKKISHWQQILASSCEQCQRNRLPELFPLMNFQEWVAQAKADHKFVLHHRTEQSLGDLTSPKNIALLVGPEGGLSTEEIERAQEHHFLPLSLGKRVLRTETAPIAALSCVQLLWGDFD